MEYDSILHKIEQDRENNSIIDLYRYNGLMQAIDFFSNRLNLEQIISSAYEFVNELLTVSKSVMYILEDGEYVVSDKKGLKDEITILPATSKLETFATFCGAVISDRAHLEEYFDNAFLNFYQVKIMIPLTMDTTLEGFILLSEKSGGYFVPDDSMICDALMRIFTGALENYRRLLKLQQANKELDEKVFNLFAINESSKILLAEHDLEMLYDLSLDVFSELTQSSRTSFFLYDEGSEKYILKAYKDIYLSKVNKETVSLTINKDPSVRPMKFLIDVNNTRDMEYFNHLFVEGINGLSFSKPLYIVLLLKASQVLGFVTLGETVSGEPYKSSIFELVESLASFTYIAISNAILLKKLDEHKRLLQDKLDRLQSLNRLMKNVNSAESLETLQELILRTLEVSFGVEKGALALLQPHNQSLVICSEVGMSTEKRCIALNDRWKKLYRGSIVLETNEEEVYHYIGKDMHEAIGEKSGMLAVPIYLEKDEIQLLGVFLIYKMRSGYLSDDENLIVMETIANLSAPILQNYIKLEDERETLATNYKKAFLRELKKQADECVALNTPLEVIYVVTEVPLFSENKLSENLIQEFECIYPVDHNHILGIVISDFQYYRHKAAEIAQEYGGRLTVYTLGKDFTGFEDFLGHIGV